MDLQGEDELQPCQTDRIHDLVNYFFIMFQDPIIMANIISAKKL